MMLLRMTAEATSGLPMMLLAVAAIVIATNIISNSCSASEEAYRRESDGDFYQRYSDEHFPLKDSDEDFYLPNVDEDYTQLDRDYLKKLKENGEKESVDTPGGVTRQMFGGIGLPEADIPEWWLPLTGVRTCSAFDGYLCGNGIRLPFGYFLGQDRSVKRVLQTFEGSPVPYEPPGMFIIPPDPVFDVSKPNEKGWQWIPDFKKHYKYNISIYRMKIREGASGSDVKLARKAHPLKKNVPLEFQIRTNKKPCYIFNYGDNELGFDGADKSPTGLRTVRAVYVQVDLCDKDKCVLTKFDNVTYIREGKTGFVCGAFSNLGAPVICGTGNNSRITYILSDQRQFGNKQPFWNPSRPCTQSFQAFRVAYFAKQIVDDIKNWTSDRRHLPWAKPTHFR